MIGMIYFARKFLVKIKGSVYKSCVKSAMLYGSKTWCLGQNEAGILHRTKSHGDKYVLSEIIGQEVDKRCNADVVLEWSNRSAGKD